MKFLQKSALAGWLVCLLLIMNIPIAWGQQGDCGMIAKPDLKMEARSAILLEPFTKEVLFEKNADQVMPPASVTKLMVMLLALESLEKQQIKLTDVITASPEACKMGGSQIWLEPGEQMTVAELLKAVCIVSANDASYALAEHLAGSEENFINLMNKRARELGLKNTKYVNTTGLDPASGGPGNLTTARDMALLASEVIKYPLVFKWTGVWIDSLRGGKSFLRNTNNMVRFYQGCDGLKTGYTTQAGYCLVATAKRNGVRLVAVVMNAPTIKDRAKDIGKMFNYGFSQYKAIKIYNGGEVLGRVKVFKGVEDTAEVMVSKELNVILKYNQKGEITKTVEIDQMITAPVAAGQKVGRVLIKIDGKEYRSINLITKKAIPGSSYFELFVRFLAGLVKRAVN